MNSIFFERFFFSFGYCESFEPIKVNACSAKPTALDSSIMKGTRFFGSFTLFLRLLVTYNPRGQGHYITLNDS